MIGKNCNLSNSSSSSSSLKMIDEVVELSRNNYEPVASPEDPDAVSARSESGSSLSFMDGVKHVTSVFNRISIAEKLAREGKHILGFLDVTDIARAYEAGVRVQLPSSVVKGESDSDIPPLSLSESEQSTTASSSTVTSDSASESGSLIEDPTAPSLPTDSLNNSDDLDRRIKEELKLSQFEAANAEKAKQSLTSSSSTRESVLSQEAHSSLDVGAPEKRKFFAQITERAANLKVANPLILTNDASGKKIQIPESAGAAGARSGSGGSLTLILTVNRDTVGLETVRELQSLSDGHVWIGWETETETVSSVVTKHPNRVDYRKSCTRFGLGSHQHLRLTGRHATLQQVAAKLRLELASALQVRKTQSHSKTLHPLDARLCDLMRQVELVLEQDLCTTNNLSRLTISPEEQSLLLLAASSYDFKKEFNLTTTSISKSELENTTVTTNTNSKSNTTLEDLLQGGGLFLKFLRTSAMSNGLVRKIRNEGAAKPVEAETLARELMMSLKVFKGLVEAGERFK